LQEISTCNHLKPFIEEYNNGKAVGADAPHLPCRYSFAVGFSRIRRDAGLVVDLDLAGGGVEDEQIVSHNLMEVEHRTDGIRDSIE
jgi:hypothetical protein